MRRRIVRNSILAVAGVAALTFPAWGSVMTAGSSHASSAAASCDPTIAIETCIPPVHETPLPPGTVPSTLPSTGPTPTVPAVPTVPALDITFTTGCLRVGDAGVGCDFIFNGERLFAGGAQVAEPGHAAILPSTNPTPRPRFIIEISTVDPFGAPGKVIARCTGFSACFSSVPTTQIAAGTLLNCTLVAADGPSAIGCVSASANATPPSIPPVPSTPPTPSGPPSWAGTMCLATDGSPCQINAGAKSEDIIVNGQTVATGRGSWLAHGTWTIDMYFTPDCSGAPYKSVSSTDGNNDPSGLGLGGSNNGGGYYGSCIKATATGPDSFVLMGDLASPLIP